MSETILRKKIINSLNSTIYPQTDEESVLCDNGTKSLKSKLEDLDDKYIEIPTGGSNGLSLKKTSNGAEWDNIDYENDVTNKPKINNVTLNLNKTASDLGLATAAQGTKADDAIPMPSTGTDGQILEKDSTTTNGVKWSDKPSDGKSAYEIWYEENEYDDPTTYNEDYFLASLKAQFGSFVPADYGTDGIPASGGSDITASANTTNYIYLVDNNNTTPTAKTMWITVVDDSDPNNIIYNWTSIGDVQVDLTFGSGQAVTSVHIKDENGDDDPDAQGVLSAEAGVRLNNKIVKVVGTNLYDGNGDTFVSSGTTYKRHCYVPIDSVNHSVVTISCAGTQGIAYIYPYNVVGGSLSTVTFFLSDGTTTVVAETSHAYTPDNRRGGSRFAIPSNAVGLGFGYRITPAGSATQDLVRDVMVSYGTKIYASYMEYEEGYILRNPYFDPYVAAVKNEVYIAPDGNDLSGDGSLTTPFLTLNRALQTGKDVVMRGGLYNMNACNLSNAPYTKIRISAYPNETPIIFYGNKIANTATLMSGSSKVYEKTIADPNCNWLFQWGIPDESTLIPDSERVAYHGNRLYRMPWATHIDRATSIQQIEDSENYMFYYDTTAGKIYFSCPQEPSSDNFIYCGLGGFFSGFAGKELDMKGIVFVGCSCNLGPENESTGGIGVTNSLIEDCVVLGTRMACWNLNNTQNVTLIRCEAAWSDSGRGQGGNDGFNAHSGADYEVTFKMIDCYSHDNGNDGYSDHQKCRGIIEGGLFEHNSLFGVGCGLTPAYGACDIIRNVISQNNNSRGIGYFGVTDTTKCGVVIMNCVSRNNRSDGFYLSDSAFVEVIGCVTYGNSRGIKGSTTKNIKVIDTKSFNNTNPDSNVDLVDAQS